MIATSIDEVRKRLHGTHDPEYVKKQLHRFPDAPEVKRVPFLLDMCRGKTIVHLGASGVLQDELVKVCTKVYGLDKNAGDGIVAMDFDDYHAALPTYEGVDLVLAGEILEHLSNPGWLLTRLKAAYPSTPLLVTVPNAFTFIQPPYLKKGIENVNIDHVAWYSYTTLTTLLARHGYVPAEFCWYNGKPGVAEGLIMLTE
jgi:hypothetical protein